MFNENIKKEQLICHNYVRNHNTQYEIFEVG